MQLHYVLQQHMTYIYSRHGKVLTVQINMELSDVLAMQISISVCEQLCGKLEIFHSSVTALVHFSGDGHCRH